MSFVLTILYHSTLYLVQVEISSGLTLSGSVAVMFNMTCPIGKYSLMVVWYEVSSNIGVLGFLVTVIVTVDVAT